MFWVVEEKRGAKEVKLRGSSIKFQEQKNVERLNDDDKLKNKK